MPAHIERVSERDRNDLYQITMECGCVVKYEPDASAPHDYQMKDCCEEATPEHVLIAIATAQMEEAA